MGAPSSWLLPSLDRIPSSLPSAQGDLPGLSCVPPTRALESTSSRTQYSQTTAFNLGSEVLIASGLTLFLGLGLHELGNLYFSSWEAHTIIRKIQFKVIAFYVVVVQSLSRVWLFATPWTAACQTSLSFTIILNLLEVMSIELVMPSNHLIFCHLFFQLPSSFPNITVFSKLALCIRWPKYWHSSFSVSPFSEYSGLLVWILSLLVWNVSLLDPLKKMRCLLLGWGKVSCPNMQTWEYLAIFS